MLFSSEHFLEAAAAYLRGIERRVIAGKDTNVSSFASFFISPWDVAVLKRVPERLTATLGIASSQRIYRVYRDWLATSPVKKIVAEGFTPQCLLFAVTEKQECRASDIFYIPAPTAPDTVTVVSKARLLDFADQRAVGALMPSDGGDCEQVLAEFTKAGVDLDALAARLQSEGVETLHKSWNDLMQVIRRKSAFLQAGVRVKPQ